jgi:uncharacterized protein YdcH (DUF465 family)
VTAAVMMTIAAQMARQQKQKEQRWQNAYATRVPASHSEGREMKKQRVQLQQ